MPMSVKVLAWKQPADGVLKIGLGAAAGLDQRDAGGRMRNKDVTESVAPVTTELSDHMSDIGDEASSGVQLHDIRVHSPIIAFRCRLARWFPQRALVHKTSHPRRSTPHLEAALRKQAGTKTTQQRSGAGS